MKAIAYIDGFNLYHGIVEKYGKKYLWLDLEEMCRSMIRDHDVDLVRYYTAPRRNAPPSERRQKLWWRALEIRCPRLEFNKGRFQEKHPGCFKCGHSWRSYEEKESDVALGVALAEDAIYRRMDTALIVGADADYLPAIRSVRRNAPHVEIRAAFPPARRSNEVRDAVDVQFQIWEKTLRQAQMADQVLDAENEKYLERPDEWTS